MKSVNLHLTQSPLQGERGDRCMCVCVFLLVCVSEWERYEKDSQRCIKSTHPFTVMISSYYQQPELVASQAELFCSESTQQAV